MRATLVHNERSGGAASEAELLRALAEIGWKVERSVPRAELDEHLLHGTDVIVVAGGDGTIASVAKRLAGTGLPMAIVPMGTANNFARSLGLPLVPGAAILGLLEAAPRQLDLGVVRTNRDKTQFLEGFGVGVFAYVIAERASTDDKKLHKALCLIAEELRNYAPPHFELEVDGRDLSGEYLLAAVMNTQSIGPALALAPAAKCDDGQLDVVLVRPEERLHLVAHLKRAAEIGDVARPEFETQRATHVRVRADGRWSHVDDTARELDGVVTIDIAEGAVTLLAPPVP